MRVVLGNVLGGAKSEWLVGKGKNGNKRPDFREAKLTNESANDKTEYGSVG